MASRKMTKEKQKKISKQIRENRQTHYDENVDRMRRPMEAAMEDWRAIDLPSTHPDKKDAFDKMREAQAAYYDWQEENEPDSIDATAARRRKKLLGNRKKNRQKEKFKTQVFDADALRAQRNAVRTGPTFDFSSWLFDGALVMTKSKDVGLVVGVTNAEYAQVMVNGTVDWLLKKTLRPADDD